MYGSHVVQAGILRWEGRCRNTIERKPPLPYPEGPDLHYGWQSSYPIFTSNVLLAPCIRTFSSLQVYSWLSFTVHEHVLPLYILYTAASRSPYRLALIHDLSRNYRGDILEQAPPTYNSFLSAVVVAAFGFVEPGGDLRLEKTSSETAAMPRAPRLYATARPAHQ